MTENTNEKKIYLFCILIYSFFKMVTSTYLDMIIPFYSFFNSLSLYIVLILLFSIIILRDKITKKKLLRIFLLSILIIAIFIENSDKNLFVLIFFIISFPKNLDIKIIAKNQFLLNSFIILLTIILCKFDILPDYTFANRNTIRHGLGFVSSNALSNLVTSTLLIFIYWKEKKWKFLYFIVWLPILVYINIQTDSRLAFLLGIIALCLIMFIKKLNNNLIKKFIFLISKYIFILLFIGLLLITIYLSSTSYKDIFYKVNDFFSGRLNQMIKFYNQYGIHFIGRSIFTLGIRNATATGNSWVGIDTSYLNYTLRYGLIFMMYFSLNYIKLGKYMKNNDNLFEALYVIIICIMGITENIIFLPYFNISIFFIAEMLSISKSDN